MLVQRANSFPTFERNNNFDIMEDERKINSAPDLSKNDFKLNFQRIVDKNEKMCSMFHDEYEGRARFTVVVKLMRQE